MKRILITGKNSYIGTNVRRYLERYPQQFIVEELDVRDDGWRAFDFSGYDVVYHVAGLAHIKERKENELLYYKVNRDLALSVARKAKEAGVKQFIFMSSMSVYGLIYAKEEITKDTACQPTTYYGKSKYDAEQCLQLLEDANFKVCIVRPPMVYGKDAPGNLEKLLQAVRKLHVFPTITNERSSITIEKLCEYIKAFIDQEKQGVLLPQNKQYMCTFAFVEDKMKQENVKVFYLSLFNPLIRMLIGRNKLITKCFGDLKYEK